MTGERSAVSAAVPAALPVGRQGRQDRRAVSDDRQGRQEQRIEWRYTPKQEALLDLLEDPAVEVVLYGGAKGGGKTVAGVRWVIRYCEALIEQLGLRRTLHPVPVGFMGRKRLVDFRATTLETWFEQAPAGLYRHVEQKHELIIRQAVKVIYGGFDDRDDVQKFNSAEYVFAFLDQAEEITQTEFGMVRATLRRRIHGRALPPKVLLTANPARCWLKAEFIDKPRDTGPWRFLQALPSDNPMLAEGYLQTLQSSFAHRPELLAAYLHGSWEEVEGANAIIRSQWLRLARTLTPTSADVRHALVCDPARYGDDETVIYYFRNHRIEKELIYGQQSTEVTADHLATLAGECRIGGLPVGRQGSEPVVAIDADGIGGPILDKLERWGKRTVPMQGSGRATDPQRFFNLRAEWWWTVGSRYARHEYCEGPLAPGGRVHEDPELDRQLTAVEYLWRAGRILVQAKDEIKRALGRSPDRADAKVMGLYLIDTLPAVEDEPHYSGQDEDECGDLAASYVTRTVLA